LLRLAKIKFIKRTTFAAAARSCQHGENRMRYKWLVLAAVGAAALGFAASGADAKVGRRCGGILQITCGPGEWCDPTPGHCKPGARGHCVKVPELCPFEIFAPVCGCNGQTFPNNCFRIKDKVAEKHKGKC
jgi:hypothetical protein